MATPTLFERAIHAAKHPVASTAYVVGLVRGSAAALLRAAAGGAKAMKGDHASGSEALGRDLADAPGPAPERAPEPPHESFATEPHAVTRHGSAAEDEAVDDWYGEATEPDTDSETGGVVEALEQGDRGQQVDEGELKAIISESETLRKAADLDKG